MNESDNMLKYENYREQFGRLKKALASGFNLEAVFIEYAILEDRTESILRHADKWEAYLKSLKGRQAKLDTKIKYIQKLAEQKRSLPNRYFSGDLLDRVLEWKEDRNRLIHALMKQQLAHGEIGEVAAQGKSLADELRKRAGNFNRAADRQNEK